MFRNYPLTWLFIIATVCVDLAVLFATERGADRNSAGGIWFYVWNYALPAQLSALALWAVLGKVHSFTRAAWVTSVNGVLLLLTWQVSAGSYQRETIAIHFIQVSVVTLGIALLRSCGFIRREKNAKEEKLQFSLMEIFGWTIVVALWAFAVRFAGTDFPVDREWIIWVIALTVGPILLAPILFNRISLKPRFFWLVSLYLVALLGYFFSRTYISGPMPLWAFSMAITQITYISAWWAMMRMDEAMQERRAISAASREKLAIYDPNES